MVGFENNVAALFSQKTRAAIDLSWKGTADGSLPVSYTHLRAHETVLDLVCRLLLEKKKNYSRLNGVSIVTL